MSCTVSQIHRGERHVGPDFWSVGPEIHRLEISWAADAAGNYAEAIPAVSGQIVRIVFVPGEGSNQPADLYDVVLADEDGIDVLSGQGANLSNASKSSLSPSVPQAVSGDLLFKVTSAGNAKSGRVVIYVRP